MKRGSFVWLCVALVAAISTGCGGSYTALNVESGREALEEQWAEAPAAAPAADGAIAVNIVTPAVYGCISPPRPPDAGLRDPNPPYESFEAASIEEAEQRISQALDSGEGASAMIVESVGDQLADIARHHLEQRFGQVSVTVNAPSPPPDAISVRVSFNVTKSPGRDPHVTALALHAEMPQGEPLAIEVSGETRNNHGHLAWSIPVMLITFPIGIPIVFGAWNSITESVISTSIALALDEAAREFARLSADRARAPAPVAPPAAVPAPPAPTPVDEPVSVSEQPVNEPVSASEPVTGG